MEEERITENELFTSGLAKENNHLLGKRSGPFEVDSENLEPDAEKKNKHDSEVRALMVEA